MIGVGNSRPAHKCCCERLVRVRADVDCHVCYRIGLTGDLRGEYDHYHIHVGVCGHCSKSMIIPCFVRVSANVDWIIKGGRFR